MDNTYRLTTIEDAVSLAKTLRNSWFRGHKKIYSELTPAIFRKEYQQSIGLPQPNIEAFFINGFRRGAPVLEAKLPGWYEHIDWLFLMQHHGAPTRLLDWTQSALVALYFAANGCSSDDGELWAMYPDELNKCSDLDHILALDDRIVLYLAEETLCDTEGDKKALLSNLLGRSKGYDNPIAFLPAMNFPRMISQLSAFTIHPKPSSGHTIPELLSDERHLVRYIIPHDHKFELIQDLAALGITRRTLYQDLDSLCVDLKQEARVGLYSPPNPPRCSGKYKE